MASVDESAWARKSRKRLWKGGNPHDLPAGATRSALVSCSSLVSLNWNTARSYGTTVWDRSSAYRNSSHRLRLERRKGIHHETNQGKQPQKKKETTTTTTSTTATFLCFLSSSSSSSSSHRPNETSTTFELVAVSSFSGVYRTSVMFHSVNDVLISHSLSSS